MSTLYTCKNHTDDYDFCPICEIERMKTDAARAAAVTTTNTAYDADVAYDTARNDACVAAEVAYAVAYAVACAAAEVAARAAAEFADWVAHHMVQTAMTNAVWASRAVGLDAAGLGFTADEAEIAFAHAERALRFVTQARDQAHHKWDAATAGYNKFKELADKACDTASELSAAWGGSSTLFRG